MIQLNEEKKREFGVRKLKFQNFEIMKDRKSKRRRDKEGLVLRTIWLGFGLYGGQH